jgi:predicted GNAT family acetyltransferase
MQDTTRPWGELPAPQWIPTLETLHLWTQIVGKIRMVQTPWINHSWSVPLYVSPVGLRTSLVPYGSEGFELAFDLTGHELTLVTTTGQRRSTALAPRSVADLYRDVMAMMSAVGMPVAISTTPNEVVEAIPFPDDETHAAYEPEHAVALWRALLDAQRVMTRFRAGYRGKASPVHFFWGSFDLATTRFSGRAAPPHGGGVPNLPDDVTREAYSHEVTSCGFWPGNRDAPEPVFYAYAYPTPDGFPEAAVAPEGAFWLEELGEFVLPYSVVAAADEPDEVLGSFFETTHAAAADLAGWDRARLECQPPHGPDWFADRGDAASAGSTAAGGGDAAPEQVTVRDAPDDHRYVISVDGVDAGLIIYHRHDDNWILVHTEIESAFDGRGLGSHLARGVLDDVRAKSGSVVPLCPFVRRWIDRHDEYGDLVDRALTDALVGTSG